jgi:(+)-pinoresinol hydroxylase
MTRRVVISAVLLAGLLGLPAAAGAEEAAKPDGQAVFKAACLPCHGTVGPGTHMLASRLGDDHADLEKRDDLTGDYIRAVVRNGLNGMLAYRKTEVTDSELDAVIAYLTHGDANGSQ